MAKQAAITAYEDLTIELREEEGVTATPDGLLVHGKPFAFRENDDLIVELPETRAHDLVSREMAVRFSVRGGRGRGWVRIDDIQLWPELAREAREYVGEPAVGGDS